MDDKLPPPGDAPVSTYEPEWFITVKCRDEAEQTFLIEFFLRHGFEVRALFR